MELSMTSANSTEEQTLKPSSCTRCSGHVEPTLEQCPVCGTRQQDRAATFERQIYVWWKGSASEVAFWDRWHSSGGLQWPESFKQRQLPTRQFDPNLLRGLN